METRDAYIGMVLEDRYELIEKIGEGGMALVYKAMDNRLNRFVAVKIMRPEMAKEEEFRQRFFTESHAVAMLSSPNIVAVYDVSHSTDIEYIVMELVDGITLKQYMERKGKIPWREAVYFSKQIARGLAKAHEKGLVHRDIKPQNMLLLRDGTLKVGDFGIAALESEIADERGTAIGSIHYIAPEQIRGENPDARSDLYSLGVVLYEMLTGAKPFTGETVGEIAVKHMNTVPRPIRELAEDVPPELEQIAFKAMNPNILERYQTAEEFIQDLDRFSHNQAQQEDEAEVVSLETPSVVPVRSVSEMSKEKFRLRRRRSGRVSFLTGVFGVIVVALFLYAFLNRYFINEIFPDRNAEDYVVRTHVELPNFQGQEYEAILSDPANSVYKFEVILLSPSATTVERQEPAAGTREVVRAEGIPVRLYVSSGLSQVPEVTGQDYREATAMLRVSGYYVEILDETTQDVPRNQVMSMYPSAGSELSKGSVVYLTVSAGPEIVYVPMPNLIGLSEVAAIQKIEVCELSYGGSEYVSSELPAGTVIGMNATANTMVQSHGKVILKVSTGPEDA